MIKVGQIRLTKAGKLAATAAQLPPAIDGLPGRNNHTPFDMDTLMGHARRPALPPALSHAHPAPPSAQPVAF